MTSAASALLEIQEADLEAGRLRKQLDELPEKTAILKVRAQMKEADRFTVKADAVLGSHNAALKAFQDETDSLTARIESEQAKLMETTDHRMVQSITREMDGFRRRIDKVEMEMLSHMETIEKAQAKKDEIAAHRTRLEDKETQLIAEYRAAGGALQVRIAEVTAHRDRRASAVPPGDLARYETARDAKGGIGVGRLEGSRCSACHLDIPNAKLDAVLNGGVISTCPMCHRLLVTQGES